MINKSIDNKKYHKILELSKKGERAFKNKAYENAIEFYNEAINLIPYPVFDWDAATWLYTAIGDCFYFQKKFKSSLNNFHDAFNSPGGKENPFVNLRLGQCYYELKAKEKAEDYLMRAYMLDGKKIFKYEKKKYLNYLKKKYHL